MKKKNLSEGRVATATNIDRYNSKCKTQILNLTIFFDIRNRIIGIYAHEEQKEMGFFRFCDLCDRNGTRTYKHLVRKRTLNHLAKLTKEFLRAKSSLTFRQL